jgi:anaerobic selenocysteine-containing dehydrogenase
VIAAAVETTRLSFCRCCLNRCAIRVKIEDGHATRVTGDRDDPLYGGYSCIKGRSQPELRYGSDRLRTSLKRLPDGRFAPVPVEQAMDEIASRLLAIREEYGPRAIAGYAGTMKIAPTGADPLYKSLMRLFRVRDDLRHDHYR